MYFSFYTLPQPLLFFSLNLTRNYVFPGLMFSSKTISGNLNSNLKSAVMKGSTLMKPTASQLAKQNRPPHNISSR